MKLNKLKLKNFKSFEDTEIDFTKVKGNILITGDNRDQEGQNSNGSGKTSLFEGISFALLGKTPKSIYVEDIIREGTEQCEVELTVEKDKDILIINRQRGKVDKLSFTINGSDEHPKSTNTVTQNALLTYLGIDPENKHYFNDFLNTTYFSIDMLKGFAGKETTSEERMKLVCRFLNLEILDKATKVVRDSKTKNNTVLGKVEASKQTLEKVLESIPDEEKLKKEDNRITKNSLDAQIEIKKWKDSNSKLEKDIEKVNKITHIEDNIHTIIVAKNQFFDMIKSDYKRMEIESDRYLKLNAERESLVNELAKLPNLNNIDEDIREINDEYIEGKNKYVELQIKESKLSTKVTEQTDILKGTYACPECTVPLMMIEGKLQNFDKDIAVLELTKQKENLRKTKVSLDNKIKKVSVLEKKLTKLQESKQKRTQLLNSIESLESNLPDVIEIEAGIATLNKKVKDKTKEFDDQIKELSEKLRELKDKLVVTSIKPMRESIKEANEQIKYWEDTLYKLNVDRGKLDSHILTYKNNVDELEKLKTEIQGLRNEIGDCTFLQSCYTTTRRWKIESFIPEFQTITNKYLSLLKCGISISLDTMRKKKSNKKDEDKYTPDFTIKVLDTGGFERGFESFSDGESARIAICVGLALRDIVINKSGFGFNFLLMDQFLDGVDEVGAEEIINMLNPNEGQNMVISHNDALQRLFNKKICIVKENNISRIV